MERVLSVEEKMKRAEEIYARRKNNQAVGGRVTTVPVNEKKDFKLFKKILVQMLICLLIYCIFYLIHDTNYLFSDDVLHKTNEILSYDINFNHLYEQMMSYINGLIPKEKQEEQTSEGIQTGNEQNYQEETLSATDVKEQQTEQPKDQMQLDAEYVKQNCSFIKPVNGTITSEFGERENTNPIVTPNHIGIDIAANQGTVVKSAMTGKVSIASYNSSYR